MDAGEACDDGNQDDEDECTNRCTIAACGDGVVHELNGEECDDGDWDNTNSGTNACRFNTCGDGVRFLTTDDEHNPYAPEECDSGEPIESRNTGPSDDAWLDTADTCSASCTAL